MLDPVTVFGTLVSMRKVANLLVNQVASLGLGEESLAEQNAACSSSSMNERELVCPPSSRRPLVEMLVRFSAYWVAFPAVSRVPSHNGLRECRRVAARERDTTNMSTLL